MEIEKQIISLVKDRPELYASSARNQNSASARQAAWEAISTATGLSSNQCKKLWTRLRNRFGNARRRRTSEECNWMHWQDMAFLLEHCNELAHAPNSRGQNDNGAKDNNFEQDDRSADVDNYLYTTPTTDELNTPKDEPLWMTAMAPEILEPMAACGSMPSPHLAIDYVEDVYGSGPSSITSTSVPAAASASRKRTMHDASGNDRAAKILSPAEQASSVASTERNIAVKGRRVAHDRLYDWLRDAVWDFPPRERQEANERITHIVHELTRKIVLSE